MGSVYLEETAEEADNRNTYWNQISEVVNVRIMSCAIVIKALYCHFFIQLLTCFSTSGSDFLCCGSEAR
jgi:hypothetical protein